MCAIDGIARVWIISPEFIMFSRFVRGGRGASRSSVVARAAVPVAHRAWMDSLENRTLLASITSTSPANGAAQIGTSANISITFASAMTASTLNASTVVVSDPAGLPMAATYSYNTTTRVLTVDPTATFSTSNNYYSVRVIGGADGVKDSGNGTLTNDYVFGFTTGSVSFTDQTVFTGLNQPTAMQFAPDGRIFVAEKRGVIKVYDSPSDTTPDVFADLRTPVYNYWDRGLLGLALDPNFTSGKPYVYVLYTFDGDVGGSFPKWGTAGQDADPGDSGGATTVSGRLSRLTANGNFMVAGSETVLVNDWQNQFPSHSIGALNFGPDGYLYASAGDGASFADVDYGQFGNPFNDPANQGGAVRSQDLLNTSDPTGLDGSVIRIDPVTGAGAPGNPYAASSDNNAKRIVAEGLRNPFRFTFRPGTNEIWISDVGWNSWEEINRITNAANGSFTNFGWPAYEGSGRNSQYDAANLPLIEGFYTAGGDTKPYYAWGHGEHIDPSGGDPTGTSSATGISFYNGSAYPVAFDGALFFADYARGTTYIAYKGVDGLPDMSTRRMLLNGPKVVDLKQSPTGEMWYVDITGQKIGKLVFAGSAAVSTPELAGAPIGTPGSYNNNGNTIAKAFDNNFSTYFDAPIADNAWVGIDAGTPHLITRIGYAPRAGYAGRMVGGRFEASNSADFSSGVVVLGTIADVPLDSRYTFMTVDASQTSYRYFRYVSPTGGYGNIAELKFFAGDGLNATYYNNMDFTGTTVSRVDAAPNFNWGTGSPDPAIGVDTFSARWTGKIQAMEGGTYTFRTTSDDGIRLWVNNVLLVDKLVDQSASSWTGTIALAAGQIYDIRIDYYENGGDALAQLEWQRPGQSMAPVPTAQLFTALPSTNTAPVPTISAPSAATKWKVGDTLAFSGTATDAEDGAIPVANLSWQIVLMHDSIVNPGNPHEHVLSAFSGVASGTFQTIDHEYPSWIELRLTAVDSRGRTTTVTRRLDPLTSVLTVASNPVGAAVSLNGNSGATGFSQTLIVGASNNVSAPATFSIGSTIYNFSGWSDGGALSHSINTPAADTTLTANYTAASTVPLAPSNLAATVQANASVALTWTDNSNNETGFTIQRRFAGWIWADVTTVAANTTSYTDTTTWASVTYEYRVIAINGANQSTPSGSLIVDTGQTGAVAPATPTGLSATAINGTRVDLTWNDNATNETGYKIERRIGTGAWTQLTTTSANAVAFTDSSVAAGTQYEYRIRATTGTLDSAYSNSALVTTPGGSTGVPIPPSTLAGVVATGPSVTLSWTDNSDNETGFKVQRRFSGWLWENLTTTAANATGFVDSTPLNSVTYEYRVDAVGTGGESPFSNVIIINTGNITPTVPVAPSALVASVVSSTRVDLTWNDNSSNETSFKLERRIGTGSWSQIAAPGANIKTYSDTTAVAGTQYEYRVRASNTAGDSSYSNSALATTPGGTGGVPNAASGLTATLQAGNIVKLVWTDNSTNETGFKIQRRYAGWIWGDIATVGANITTYNDSTVFGGGTAYEYRIVSTGTGGDGPVSNAAAITTV